MLLAHPAFLFSLAALAVPVIIHLNHRRKFKDLHIGTLRFLHQAQEKRTLRMRVDNWPLLLLRLLALAALALLFSYPYLRKDAALEVTGKKTLILLDASGSMTPQMAAQARDAAESAIHAGTPDAQHVTYAEFADDVVQLASLNDYKPIPGAPTDYTRAMQWTLEHLKMQQAKEARVIIIGHLATNALPSTPPRVWPPKVKVEVIAITPPQKQDLAVRGVENLTPFVTDKMDVEAWLTPSSEEREVEFSSEGISITQKLPADAERLIFSFKPPKRLVQGQITLKNAGDPWPADDARPFSFRWSQPIMTMLLDGAPGSTPFEGQAYFIDKALSASGSSHGVSSFKSEIHYGIESRQGMMDLSRFHSFAICNPSTPATADVRSIAAQVDMGKGLLITLDQRWNPAQGQSMIDAGLLPPGIEVRNAQSPQRLMSWEEQHPALKPFSGKDGLNLKTFPWVAGFEVGDTTGWKTLARLANGQPVLLEKEPTTAEAGRILVLLQPLTREWSNLPLEPLFVPFTKSLLQYLSRYSPTESSSLIVKPGIHESRAIGTYPTSDPNAPVTIAADADEADTASVTVAAFRRCFGLPDGSSSSAQDTPVTRKTMREEAPGNDRWPWVAVILLTLLAAEIILATRNTPLGNQDPAT
jgi:Aerotolerance regulator N-terminal